MGLKPVSGKPCLYHNNLLIVFFYVDNIYVASTKENQLEL